MQFPHAVKTDQHRGGVGTTAAQSCTDGNFFSNANANRSINLSFLHQQFCGAIGDIVPTQRYLRMVAANFYRRKRRGAARGGALLNVDLIIERHRHHDRIEQVIAVGAFADHPQAQIDFCRRSNLHAPLANIAAG